MSKNAIEPKQSDEIDLGDLFKLIGNFFRNLFKAFLRVFLFFKKNLIRLVVLIILGLVIGIGLSKIVTKKFKNEVIVRSNFGSKEYLYNKVDEIKNNISNRDSLFLTKLQIDEEDLKGFNFKIEEIENEVIEEDEREQYLELLKAFPTEKFALEGVRAELIKKRSLNHKITFYFDNSDLGIELSKKILQIINSNSYFQELKNVSNKNLELRIQKNENQLSQINELISNYSKSLLKETDKNSTTTIFNAEGSALNIGDAMRLRISLLKENEAAAIDLLEEQDVISIISFGGVQGDSESLFVNMTKVLPIVFVSLFFLFTFIVYLNRKSKELLK
ncbi:hypothetical protein Q4566_05945 [Tamlana sp. 2_MG-2023]|uniref:hypothetical protein n=1 Tax=unclassified Tamlana TaxID=2614803 RepID=UPI0026E1AA5F|nr:MULTISPECIES: hypothetical protein [unclassified Tamlana]MDO6759736.1 hypothetical protein [Tamlana sp. 2_MG-2023]MDO6791359.1 hypothetical protein [Tamlana sp. 1_MG-2023]